MRSCSLFIPAAILVIVVGCTSGQAGSGGERQASQPLRRMPGVTAPDQFPRGCVDCHVNRPDLKMDVRISTIMERWQDNVPPEVLARIRPFAPVGMALRGKHPTIQAETADVPKACLTCHSKASRSAPPLAPLLHGLHLVGGEKNHFLSMFEGECTHCHKLDAATGLWFLGGGKEKP